MSQLIPVLISAKTFTVYAIKNILLWLSQAMHLGLTYFIDSLYVQTGNYLKQPASFSILLVLLSRPASFTLSFADSRYKH